MTGPFGGRVAVVTGGAQGIGQATAKALADAGARVASLDVLPQATTSFALPIPCDLRDADQVTCAFKEVSDELGPVSLLVNNASVNAYFSARDMTVDDWEVFFAVDLRAAWLCIRAALPGMAAAGRGAVVNVSSIHAHLTVPGMFPYAAAKAGLLGLTRSLALDLAPSGVRVNAVCPGWVRTASVEKQLAMSADPEAALERGVKEGVANAVLVKPNQIGTLSGAAVVLERARSAGYATVVSARSGETEDSWLADLAVGWGAGQVKVGSTTRSERTAKWNRILRIEHTLGPKARYAGVTALAPIDRPSQSPTEPTIGFERDDKSDGPAGNSGGTKSSLRPDQSEGTAN